MTPRYIIFIMPARVYRHAIGPNILEKLRPFAQLHSSLSSKEFKTKWEVWCTTNELLIASESRRLVSLDYSGDIISKLYRAARYYFKTKPPTLTPQRKSNSTPYLSLSPVLLRSMDTHIRANLAGTEPQPPATLYSNYIATHVELIPLFTAEAERLRDHANLSDDAIASKFKKTYKNRYFLMARAVSERARPSNANRIE